MTGIHPTGDRGPWFEVSGHPIYTPALLVGLGIVSMLLTTGAIALNHSTLREVVEFSSDAMLRHGEVWRAVSYAGWNPPSIWFALDMFMLWWFGRELEGFFGRQIFLKLCAGLVFAPVLVGMVVGLLVPVEWAGMPGNFSLFVAYATLAPGVTMLGGISAMWMAIIFLTIQVLSCLAGHAWGESVVAVSGAAFAFLYVRFHQGKWEMPHLVILARKPQFRVLEPVSHPASERMSPLPAELTDESDAMDAIDPLLEKIAKSGLSSLTSGERKQLQLAREVLLRKESVRR